MASTWPDDRFDFSHGFAVRNPLFLNGPKSFSPYRCDWALCGERPRHVKLDRSYPLGKGAPRAERSIPWASFVLLAFRLQLCYNSSPSQRIVEGEGRDTTLEEELLYNLDSEMLAFV